MGSEERRGIVRWLRPGFQNPTGAATAQGAFALPAATVPTSKKATTKRAPWPKGLADQTRAATAEELARTFTRAPADKVADLLEILASSAKPAPRARGGTSDRETERDRPFNDN